MDNPIEKNNRCFGQNRLLLLLALMGLIVASSLGGYYIGVHNQQGQSKEMDEDLPAFLIKIDTREHLYLMTLIEKQKMDKATEYLFMRIMDNLQAVNEIDRRTIGPKFAIDDHKELCNLLTSLENLGKSKIIGTVPGSASLIPSFQAEVSTLAQTCAHIK